MTPENYIVKEHPSLHVLCRQDGAIQVLDKGQKQDSISPKMHWTYGSPYTGGYLRVTIGHRNYLAHRIIAEAFIPNDLHKPTIDHINRNREDNNVSNLRWATHKEQQLNQHRVDNELQLYGVRCSEDPKAYSRAYEKKNRAKRTEAQRIRRAKKKEGKQC